jgi:hypothetical protein
MALTYVGGTSGTGTGASYTISLNGTLTGGIGTSPQQGDIIIVAAGHGSTSSGSPTCTGNSSGSYTPAHAALYANDTWDNNFRVFYTIAGATPDTTITIGRANNTSYGGATVVHVWRGIDKTNPLDVTPTTATGINGSRPDAPSITPVTFGAVIIAAGSGQQDTAGSAFTIPSGMGNGVSVKSDGSTSDTGTFIASIAWTGGAYNPAAATGGTTSSNSSWCASTIALRPEAITITRTENTTWGDVFAGYIQRLLGTDLIEFVFGSGPIVKTITETITATETIIRTIARKVTETAAHTDTANKTTARTRTETTTLIDTFAKVLFAVKTLAETITGSDAIIRAITRAITEAATLADTAVRMISKTIAEATNTFIDTVINAKATAKELIETGTIADTITRRPGKNLTETATHSDTAIRTTTRTLLENRNIADTIAMTISRAWTELNTLADTVISAKIAVKLLSEAAAIADTITRTITRVWNEAAAIADTITRTGARTLADTMQATDSVVRFIARTLADNLTNLDTLIAQRIGGFVNKTLTETVNAVETMSRTIARGITNTIGAVDEIGRSVGRTLADTATVAEEIARTLARTMAEHETITDTVALIKHIRQRIGTFIARSLTGITYQVRKPREVTDTKRNTSATARSGKRSGQVTADNKPQHIITP